MIVNKVTYCYISVFKRNCFVLTSYMVSHHYPNYIKTFTLHTATLKAIYNILSCKLDKKFTKYICDEVNDVYKLLHK